MGRLSWRRRCMNGEMEGGISNFGTRFSEIWQSYELIPRLKFRTSRRLVIGRYSRIFQIFAGNYFGRGEGVLPPTVGAHGV